MSIRQESEYPYFEDLKDVGGECEDHFYIVAQRLLDAIKDVEQFQDSQHEEIRVLLTQTVENLKRVEAKVDAMENRLLQPGCLYILKPQITPAGQTANVCIADALHVAETHLKEEAAKK